jgi:hypothetical protein
MVTGVQTCALPIYGAALHAVHTRNQQRGTMALRAEELAALRLGRFFHFVQLDHCTQGEMQAAIEAVRRRVQQALAGNAPRDARICVGGLRGGCSALACA